MDLKKLTKSGLPKGVIRPLIGAALLTLAGSATAFADCGFSVGDAAKGDEIYHETCVACHGENGKGVVPGAPDFTEKGGPLSKPHQIMAQHMMNGFSEPDKPLGMPPMGGNPDLTDEDIKDVHAYLHHTFGCGTP